jgi:hypothetical protein
MKKSNLVLESSTIGLGDEWIIYITVSRIQSNDAFIARLVDQNTKEKTILYKPIDHEKCQPYDEDGAALLLFAEDFNYFRTCSPNCTLAQRTALPQVSLELLRAGSGAAVLSHIESCLDEGIPGDPPAAAYSPFSLAILSPPAGAVLGGGPVDVRYVVRRADSISRCATAMVAARLGGRAHTEVRMVRGACDAESLVRLDAIPRGTHLLELEALDAAGRPLAAARVYFAHPGPGLRESPADALCLLAYTQSGSHLLRFVLEFLTGRPTAGCPGNIADPPIHANRFPGPGPNPLAHVDPFALPAAHKFHYSAPARAGCTLADPEHGPHCRRLALLVRDPADAVPRYFEAAAVLLRPPAVAEQAALYLANVRRFAGFPGPKLLVRFEDLVGGGPAAAAAVAAFLGPDDAPPERGAALAAEWDGLLERNRGATGRAWAGVRPVGAPPRLAGWSPGLLCALGGPLAEALDGEPGGLTAEVLRQYEPSIRRLAAACVD